MKYRLILFAAVLVLSVGMGTAVSATDTTAVDQAPEAVFSGLKYAFDKVVDGTQVTHDFTVKNTGKGVLEISRVKTG
jgi:hypothetical protein